MRNKKTVTAHFDFKKQYHDILFVQFKLQTNIADTVEFSTGYLTNYFVLEVNVLSKGANLLRELESAVSLVTVVWSVTA